MTEPAGEEAGAGVPAGAGHRADVQREGQRRARRRPAACGRPRRRRPRRRRRQPGRDRRPGRRSGGGGPPDPGDAPVEQAGPRRGLRGRVRVGTGARVRRAGRDGRRRLPPARAAARPAGCPLLGRPGDRLAVGARRARRQLAAEPPAALPRRQHLRADDAGLRGPRRDRWLSGLPQTDPGGAHARGREQRGLLFSGGPGLARRAARLSSSPRCRSASSSASSAPAR